MRAITVVCTLHSRRAYVDRAHAVGSLAEMAAEQKLGKAPICRQRQFSLLFLKMLVLSALDLEFLSDLGHKLSSISVSRGTYHISVPTSLYMDSAH